MTLEQIIKLLEGGFTKEDILKMKPKETETPSKEAETPPKEADFTEVVNSISENILKKLQAQNILNSSGKKENTENAVDVLANIINPELKEED